jgi:hypothetical protein
MSLWKLKSFIIRWKEQDNSSFLPDATNMSIDEQFIYNFKKMAVNYLNLEKLKSNSKTFFKKWLVWKYRVMLWTKTFQYT